MHFERLSDEQRRSLDRATKRYAEALEGSPAISWLEDRGIPADVARTFRLGYVDEPEVGHEQAQGALAIPYVTPSGVVGMRFRYLDDRKGKYWQPPGSRTRLYGVENLHLGEPYIALCEGELDALVMTALCDVPAVGLPGVSNWKPHFKRLFEDYETVFIVMDFWKRDEGEIVEDGAGRVAAEKLRSELPNGVIVDLGIGDVNEAFLEEGPEYVRERLGLDG